MQYAFRGLRRGSTWFDGQAVDALQVMAGSFRDAWELVSSDVREIHQTRVGQDAAQVVEFGYSALSDPTQFGPILFQKWHEQLQTALELLSVDAEGPQAPGEAPSAQSLADRLARGTEASKRRVSGALALVNSIIIGSTAMSATLEASSGGTIRSLAEGIQSFVWANGLGSLTPLAFQPQIQSSLQPYLTRHYNSRAQAQIPPVTDIIRFQLREVFLAGRREELVGDEARPIYDELMAQWGFDKFHSDSYWGAHWQLPSMGQLNEMLHRGIIDGAEWERFARFNDLEPVSIPRLKEIIYSPYTRVDTRRMHRMGILDDDELLQSYSDSGYFAPTVQDSTGKHRAQFVSDPDFTVHKAQGLVVFTRVFNTLPELRSRYSKGWIDSDAVLDGLRATGIPELRARAIHQTIVRADTSKRTAPERELTRGLIARAWKLRLVSFAQAAFLLSRLGWSEAEAELILSVQSMPDDPLAFVPSQLGLRLFLDTQAEDEDESSG